MSEPLSVSPYPPVTEMLLDVQFEPILGLKSAHLGFFWKDLQSRFPTIQEHPMLPPEIEDLPQDATSLGPARWLVADQLPMQRTWFVDASHNLVLQVQQDRFIQNWRRLKPDDTYPTFDTLKPQFQEHLERLDAVLQMLKLGRLVPKQCEITYINHILPNTLWHEHKDFQRIFTVWSQGPSSLGPAEKADFNQTFLMVDHDQTVGRFHASATTAHRLSDGQAVYVLKLTARGRPLGPGLEGAGRFIDLGHDWALRAFRAVVSKALNDEWEAQSHGT